MRIQTIGDLTNQWGVKVCIYGKPGVGKTRLSLTAPTPIIISGEKGLLSLRTQAPHLHAVEVHNIKEFDEVHEWAFKSIEVKNYQTIIIDSISEIADRCLSEEQNAAKISKSKDNWRPYRNLNDRLMTIFRDFRDYSTHHVYFIAKEEWEKDEQTGINTYRPSMPGKQLTLQLPYMFDEILRLQIVQAPDGSRAPWLQTSGDMQTVAKDRSGKLDFWERPDLGSIISKILT